MPRKLDSKTRRFLKKFDSQSQEQQDRQVAYIGGKLLEEARQKGAATARTMEWLIDERIDGHTKPGSYEIETLGPRINLLIAKQPREPCGQRLHEWNIPAGGDQTLECGVCGRTTPITEELTMSSLLSKRAKRSTRFRARFNQGLREAKSAIQTIH